MTTEPTTDAIETAQQTIEIASVKIHPQSREDLQQSAWDYLMRREFDWDNLAHVTRNAQLAVADARRQQAIEHGRQIRAQLGYLTDETDHRRGPWIENPELLSHEAAELIRERCRKLTIDDPDSVTRELTRQAITAQSMPTSRQLDEARAAVADRAIAALMHDIDTITNTVPLPTTEEIDAYFDSTITF